MQLSTRGGDPLPIPSPLGAISVSDISPSGSELLVVQDRNDANEFSLWILPVPSGSPRRVGEVIAHDASFSPDGDRIAYANGMTFLRRGRMVLKSARSDQLRNVDSPAWSRDGARLRYRATAAGSRSGMLWEVGVDGGNPHPLFSGAAGLCCGAWTSDGRYFLFSSREAGEEGIWAVREKTGWFQKGTGKRVLLSTGPLNHVCAIPSRAGMQIFVTGEQAQAELTRYDGHLGSSFRFWEGCRPST